MGKTRFLKIMAVLLTAALGTQPGALYAARSVPVDLDGNSSQATVDAGIGNTQTQSDSDIPSGSLFSDSTDVLTQAEVAPANGVPNPRLHLSYGRDPYANAVMLADVNRNGSGTVGEVISLMPAFYQALNSRRGNANFNANFDFDKNNTIDDDDFLTLRDVAEYEERTGEHSEENARLWNAFQLLDCGVSGQCDGRANGGIELAGHFDNYHAVQRKGPTAGSAEGYDQFPHLDLDQNACIDQDDFDALFAIAVNHTSVSARANLNAYFSADNGENGFSDIDEYVNTMQAIFPAANARSLYSSEFDFNGDGRIDDTDAAVLTETANQFFIDRSEILLETFVVVDRNPADGRLTYGEMRGILQSMYRDLAANVSRSAFDFNQDGVFNSDDFLVLDVLVEFMPPADALKLAAFKALDRVPADGILTPAEVNQRLADLRFALTQPAPGSPAYDRFPEFDVVDPGVALNQADVDVIYDVIRPIAAAQSVNLNEDGTVTIQLRGDDPNGDTLRFEIVNNPQFGDILDFNPATGFLRYRPALDYSGTDSFTFRVFDGLLYSGPAVISLNIRAVNDRPVAQPVSAQTSQGERVTIQLRGNDVDGDRLTFQISTQPRNGSLQADPADPTRYIYVPNAAYTGTDSFTYRVYDGQAYSDPVTVNITINPAPVVTVNATVALGAGIIDYARLLGIPERNAHIMSVTQPPRNGGRVIYAGRTLLFVANGIRPYTTSFTMLVQDTRTGRVTNVTVSLQVNTFFNTIFPPNRR